MKSSKAPSYAESMVMDPPGSCWALETFGSGNEVWTFYAEHSFHPDAIERFARISPNVGFGDDDEIVISSEKLAPGGWFWHIVLIIDGANKPDREV